VVKDFVGHGIGRSLHEGPQIPNHGLPGVGPRLKPGMVLAVEPMINQGEHEVEILEAYDAGVDECVIKPISPSIFMAKIAAWSRRSWTEPMSPRRTNRLRLDPSRRSAINENGEDLRLTNLEFRLLHLLMSRPGYVFKSEDIISTVWGTQRENDQSLLKNMIYRLRKKLDEEAGETNLIQTWPGGYSFQED